MLKCKSLLDDKHWLWEEWQNNIKIFSITKKEEKLFCVICGRYRKFEKP